MDTGLLCRKCGCEKAEGMSGQWGPHTYKVKCPDCRAVTWGKPGAVSWKQRAVECLRRFNDQEARELLKEINQGR